MNGYDNLKVVSYTFAGVNFAAGTSTKKLKVPRGAQLARVLDIILQASIVFTQVTTPALVQIGDGTTPDIFASLNVGGLAAGSTIGAGDITGGIWKANYLGYNYNAGAGLHDLIATLVAPTGGTPTGTADVLIVVGYDVISV